MIRGIVALVLIVLGLIISLLFERYKGTIIPYPFIFVLGGLGMALTGIILLFKGQSGEIREIKEQNNKLIKKLKANGEKIKVDFSLCEIKSNDFTEERERDLTPRIQM